MMQNQRNRALFSALKRSGFILAALVLTTGCASRTAPFDKLDKASVTIMKLQQSAAPAPAAATPAGSLIPGLPPELQQVGLQVLQQMQAQGLIPPGLIPPGILPGATPGALPAAPAQPMFRNQWAIAAQRPVVDEATRKQLLDLLGDEESFNNQRYNCFQPTMAVSFQSPELLEPIDVVVSLPCNQVAGYGFQWPHKSSGLTGEAHAALQGIYSSAFGPVPAPMPAPGAPAAPMPGAPMPMAPQPAAPMNPAMPAPAPAPAPAAPMPAAPAPGMPAAPVGPLPLPMPPPGR